jgi:hypothetical protein
MHTTIGALTGLAIGAGVSYVVVTSSQRIYNDCYVVPPALPMPEDDLAAKQSMAHKRAQLLEVESQRCSDKHPFASFFSGFKTKTSAEAMIAIPAALCGVIGAMVGHGMRKDLLPPQKV